MGDFDDDILAALLNDPYKAPDSFGVVSGAYQASKPKLSSPKLTALQKELMFGMHYGAGTSKLADIAEQHGIEYSKADIEAIKAMYESTFAPKPEKIGHLFLGGTMHGKRVKTHGMWLVEIPVPVKPNAIGLWSADELSTVGYTVQKYVLQKIALPGKDPSLSAEVFVLDEPDLMGTGYKDKLISEYMAKFFSTEKNSVNTPVLPPTPEPIPAPPVQVADGLRITIGGKTIEWTPDESQLQGLLSWAAQSLGPGKEAQ